MSYHDSSRLSICGGLIATSLVQLLLAGVFTSVGFWLTLICWPLLRPHPFLLFFGAVCLSSYCGGWLAGIVSGIASAALADYFFVSPLHTFVFALPSFLAGGMFVAISLLISWMNARQRATARKVRILNAELARQVDRFQTLFRVMPIGIAFSDDPGCSCIHPNPAFARLLGMPENSNVSLSAPEEERPAYRVFRNGIEIPADQLPMQTAAQRRQEVRDWDCEVLLADGSRLALIGCAAPLLDEAAHSQGAVCAFLDVTDRKHMQETLLQAEKLIATGAMAATLAHEINNPLETLTSILYLMKADSHLESPSRQLIATAGEELGRLGHIVKETLNLYCQTGPPLPVRIPRLIDEVIALHCNRLAGIMIEKRYGNIEPIIASEGELKVALSNLVVNALEILDGKGTLYLRVHRARDLRTRSRQGVRIVIADDGPGIAPEHRKKIFEPFYTTKDEKGAGLGLWVARILVQKSEGTLRVHAGPQGRGTCFSVFLPSRVRQALQQHVQSGKSSDLPLSSRNTVINSTSPTSQVSCPPP